jgi:hypothetical protein
MPGESPEIHRPDKIVLKESFAAIQISEGVQSLFIGSSYLRDTGLSFEEDKFFFVRNEVKKLFSDLQSHVIDDPGVCFVLGVPGTGKSLATYTFALTLLDRNYVITWIHAERFRRPKYVQFRRGHKSHGEFDRMGLGVDEFLERSSVPGCIHLVILDGVTDSGIINENLQTSCFEWVLMDRMFRRLIIVGSMSSRRKLHDDTEDQLDIKEFLFHS